MSEGWSERWAGAGGLLFVAAGVLAGASLSAPPAADSSAAALRRYLVVHHDGVLAASLLNIVAALGLLVLLAGLRQRARGLGAGLLTLAGALTVTVVTIASLLQAALVQAVPRLTEDGSVVALFAAARVLFFDGPQVGMALVLVGAMTALPRWLGVAGAVIAVLGLVDALADAGSNGGFADGVGLAGFLLTVAWVAAASWVLLRGERLGQRVPGRGAVVAA